MPKNVIFQQRIASWQLLYREEKINENNYSHIDNKTYCLYNMQYFVTQYTGPHAHTHTYTH